MIICFNDKKPIARFFRRILLICIPLALIAIRSFAVEEPYMNELKGSQVAANNFFTVRDEKFGSPEWSQIQQNVSVDNIISFEINFDTSIYFYSTPFNCTVNFDIDVYNNAGDTSAHTTISNISLSVRYDTITGKPYKGIAMYKFTGYHKFKVRINSISSAELSPIPAIFRIKGQVIVNRKYNFSDNSSDVTRYTILNGNQLKLNWTPSKYPGAEMFDVEYTHIDYSSQIGSSIRDMGNGLDSISTDSLHKWFKNNNTRITTAASNYLLNIPYDSGYILFRIRGVQIHYPDDVRWEGNWNYRASSSECTSGCPTGVVFFAGHEGSLNFQYSVTFAEEGKRKEVIGYFDGSLRNRQSVTINSTDNKTIVQESIYDVLGRPAVNILPAPTNDSTLHYFKKFNINNSGNPYSFSDLSYASCVTNAAEMSIDSGASRYYSSNNPFLGNSKYYYARYIPDAHKYPFTVTEYVADNTGRISTQGGVDTTFRIGSGHETKYFYGKPNSQTELDRLFGSEAGDKSHYLKNMVVDPNGQISVSYVDASGKTVATALAGAVPGKLHPLPSSNGAVVQVNNELIGPQDFSVNSGNYTIAASSTFLAPVTGAYVLDYKIDPLRFEKLYGPDKDSVICSNCYYDLLITVKDNCENTLRTETRSAGTIFDTACANATTIQDTISVNINKIGEYYVYYELKLSRDALNFYDSVHLVKNSDLRKLNYFLLDELKQTDFYGCYNNCQTCFDKLGTQPEFVVMFKSLFINDSVFFRPEDSLWVLTLYDSLYAHCQLIQSECGPQNVCEEKLQLLKMDISPGGQYALHDDNYNLLERPINRLDTAWRNKIAWFPDEFGNRDSVTLFTTEGEDSIRIAVKNLNDSMFIANWKDSWADSLVRLHPEYCHYLWCTVNDSSFAFDKEIEDWLDADSAKARGWFNPDDYKALLDKDPFFKPLANGANLYTRMADSLRLFSRTLLRLSQSDKNILQFIDVVLYCNKQPDGWNQCIPDSACRSRNREWSLYKQLYLNLKQRFYEEARRTSSNSVFANCINCYIGKDLLQYVDKPCPEHSDFSLVDSLGFRQYIIYNDPNNGVPHDIIVYVERKNVGELLPPPGYYLDTVSRTINEGDWYNSIIYNSNQQDFRIISIECLQDTTYVPFTDSSLCDYHCPGGVYNPYDRDSISFYIEYGNPNTPPSTVPFGYAGCQFYAVFDVKTGPSASCRFYNTWVCIYDSTCAEGGVCHEGPSFPSQCPASGTDTLYKNKIRRYAEYVDANSFINNILNGNPQQSSSEIAEKIIDQCKAGCEAEADTWINTLRRCTTDSLKLDSLRMAFIDICSKGCSQTNTFGASSIPTSIPATYHSFEEAIIGILGANAISDSCTAELLSNPYPYDRQPVYVDQLITETNYNICRKISLRKQEYLSSGFSGFFHQWLSQKFGSAYTLDSLELDDLLNSCTNCNGILKNDIVLPLIFDPSSGDCLHCDSLVVTLAAFQSKFPGLDSTNPDYEILFNNFFNHRLGFSLSFNQYRTFLDSCAVNGSYTGTLCNEPTAIENEAATNGCTAEMFATALTNATSTYLAYIDSVRKDFRNAWMTKCLNVQPSLRMTADLYEYHYTLYYYDQSGNLVKTIPPEGVDLLNAQELDTVALYRKLVNDGCYQYSDSILFNNNGKIEWAVSAFEAQPYTIEMMANFSSHADQVIISKVAESNISGTYQHQGFVIDVVSNKLRVGLYGSNVDTAYSSIAISSLNIGSLVPLNKWTHIAIQQTGNVNDPVRIYINGQAIAFDYTSNNLSQAIALTMSGSVPFIVGSHDAPNLSLPGKLRGSLKNLRVYNRLLSSDELRQNAFNACQLASNSSNLLFWSPLNNATNNLVPEQITKENGVLTGFTWIAANGKFPDHRLPTTYQYNSLNQVLQQFSPDGDTTQFFYDRLGRLIVSQNKEQKENASYSGSANRFSYTQYDALGRIKEVGEKSTPSTDIRTINLLDTNAVKSWLTYGVNRQITKTLYDNPINSYQATTTSRKRVVASIYLENANDVQGDSTLYSYDILGNVKTLVQHIKALVAVDATGKKRIDYDYDLVSSKVNMVSYQPGKGDQFFYKYSYDADNRVSACFTSRDKLVWTEEASYTYYLHGPLARTEVGHYKVQGTDYAYTLQGWLKGINSDSLSATNDMANDGLGGTMFSRVSRDVYGFKLGYYNNDYNGIGSVTPAFTSKNYTDPVSLDNSGNQLFNGNISYTTLALSKINSGAATGYSYGYDQLNRLVEMRQHNTGTTSGWTNANIIMAYRESIAYDANGNILKYLRKGASATPDMDSLSYKYNRNVDGNLINNKLTYVRDSVSSSNYAIDIDNQSANNYGYDLIGNLKRDAAEGIDTVRWTVYGKINRIAKEATNTFIDYSYDAGGNRVFKKVSAVGVTTSTFYVRDVQGNVLAIYDKKNSETLKWDEQHLYGSSRLGIWNWDTVVPPSPPIAINNPIYDSLLLGRRTYELSNHLGNVLSTISDKKIGNDSSSIVNYYSAEVLSQNDYYPGGMDMPVRQYNSTIGYRFGFNGKEKDTEGPIQYDYGFRIYDPRIVRFKSVDPLTKNYPELTPYQYASNSPVSGVDEDGLEWAYYDKDNKQVNINSSTNADKLRITGVKWVGYDIDAGGNRTPKVGSVATAYTFGLKGMTTSSVDANGNAVQKFESYASLSTAIAATDKKLGTLHGSVQDQMKSFILMAKYRFNVDLRVTDGFRSTGEQDLIFAKGRTQEQIEAEKRKRGITRKIEAKPDDFERTGAIGGYSNHNFGLAIDVVPFENGRLNWKTKYYPLIGLIGESRGLEWGHRWKTRDDMPHFQNLQGRTLRELRALPKNDKGLPIIQ